MYQGKREILNPDGYKRNTVLNICSPVAASCAAPGSGVKIRNVISDKGISLF